MTARHCPGPFSKVSPFRPMVLLSPSGPLTGLGPRPACCGPVWLLPHPWLGWCVLWVLKEISPLHPGEYQLLPTSEVDTLEVVLLATSPCYGMWPAGQ